MLWEEAPTLSAPRSNQAWSAQDAFCPCCHKELYPPEVSVEGDEVDDIEEDDGGERADQRSTALWQSIRQLPNADSVFQQLQYEHDRTPLAPPTRCFSRTPPPTGVAGGGGFDPASICEEKYCSRACMKASRSVHTHEHLTAADQRRFTPERMATINGNETAQAIVDLLVKALAVLRSHPIRVDSDGLTPFDRLSLLSAPTSGRSLNAIRPDEMTTLEEAFGPWAHEVLQRHPQQIRVDQLPGASSLRPEHRLLRALISAIQTNSFSFERAFPRLTLHPLTQAGADRQFDVSSSTFSSSSSSLGESDVDSISYAMSYSVASFMNHACCGSNNVGVVVRPPGARGQPVQVAFGALRPIRPEEELLWMYQHDSATLPDAFGFECRCPQCTKPSA